MRLRVLLGSLLFAFIVPLTAKDFLSKCRQGLAYVSRIEDVLFSDPEHVVTHVSDNFSMLSTSGSRTAAHEVAALKKVSYHMPDKNFLLAAEMNGFKEGIPIFDGVIYDAQGNPESNFNLKSVMLDELTGDNLNRSFRSANTFAKAKLKGFYQGDWMKNRGFSYSNGVYTAEKGNLFTHRSSEYVNHFAGLFGVKEEATRPTSIMIDFHSSKKEKAASVNFRISEEKDETGNPVQILSLSADGHAPRTISLSSIQRSLQGLPYVSSYLLVSGSQVVEVTPVAIHMHSKP